MTSVHQEAMRRGMEQYNTPKPEGDIDLVSVVRQDLMEAGLGQILPLAFDQNRFIIQAQGRTSEVQRQLLNRYFNLQLLSSPTPSIDERECLIPNGTIDNWLLLFREKILRYLLSNNLPVHIPS